MTEVCSRSTAQATLEPLMEVLEFIVGHIWRILEGALMTRVYNRLEMLSMDRHNLRQLQRDIGLRFG